MLLVRELVFVLEVLALAELDVDLVESVLEDTTVEDDDDEDEDRAMPIDEVDDLVVAEMAVLDVDGPGLGEPAASQLPQTRLYSATASLTSICLPKTLAVSLA